MMHAENFITEASTGQDTGRGAGEIILLADISAMGVGKVTLMLRKSKFLFIKKCGKKEKMQ